MLESGENVISTAVGDQLTYYLTSFGSVFISVIVDNEFSGPNLMKGPNNEKVVQLKESQNEVALLTCENNVYFGDCQYITKVKSALLQKDEYFVDIVSNISGFALQTSKYFTELLSNIKDKSGIYFPKTKFYFNPSHFFSKPKICLFSTRLDFLMLLNRKQLYIMEDHHQGRREQIMSIPQKYQNLDIDITRETYRIVYWQHYSNQLQIFFTKLFAVYNNSKFSDISIQSMKDQQVE